MKEVTREIRLDTIKNVQDFIAFTNTVEPDISIKSHRYIIDGKSIMGIFSLNLLEPITVTLHSSDAEIVQKFNEEMEKYILQEDELCMD